MHLVGLVHLTGDGPLGVFLNPVGAGQGVWLVLHPLWKT